MSTKTKSKPKAKVIPLSKAKEKKVNIVKEIHVDAVVDGPAKGWVHTHGLDRFGRPELEIRNVPTLFSAAACALLNEVADYMVNGTDKPVLAGQNMQLGQHTLLKFHKAEPDDKAGYDTNHYTVPRLQILGIDQKCSCCEIEAKA